MPAKDRQILQSCDHDECVSSNVLTVAADGTANFTSVADAINFAPNKGAETIFIYIKEGAYQENVEIPSWKPDIVLLGDGSNVTVISGNRSIMDAVAGERFLARDITFENTAGPEKHQAVALRLNADSAAFYWHALKGLEDAFHVQTFRQFYRGRGIYGTVDFMLFGNSVVVLQGCKIFTKLPMPGHFTVITDQSRNTPYKYTGFSIQNCSILPAID